MFCSTEGTIMQPSNFARRYRALIARSQLPYRKPHNLRHTAATIMFALGLTVAEVSRILGHSSIAITMDTYIHWIPTDTRRLSIVMADFRQPATPR